ncbi:MAG: DUF3991 domain-containing protein, partial [Ruminiclostridium sp.]|nr:DUF3991 domain-containing protein [Ruminiclostridium sp.]
MAKLQFADEQIQRANSVNIIEYARQARYKVEQVTPHSYKIPEQGGLYIHANGHKWNHFSKETGGGAIQFVMHMEGRTWVEAVKQLLSLDSSVALYEISTKDIEEKNKGVLILPEKNTTYKHLFAYLIGHRKINKEIVYDMVKRNKIYENKYNSCVFVGYDMNGEARFASIRSTNTNGKAFRCDVANSDKSYSFCIEGSSKMLYVFESPIDLMSYLTFYKLCITSEYKDHMLSLGGLSDKALERYLKNYPSITQITLCLDSDEAGRFASEQIKNKYRSDYEIYQHIPHGKDWNEDLVSYSNTREQYSR